MKKKLPIWETYDYGAHLQEASEHPARLTRWCGGTRLMEQRGENGELLATWYDVALGDDTI